MDLDRFLPDFSRDAVFRPCSREPFEFYEEGDLSDFCMDKVFNMAWWAINFCHLSYCSEKKISELIEGKGELLEIFSVRTQFAYAVKMGDLVFIVFQGSCSREDALLDMNFLPKKSDSLALHRGFSKAFNYLWPQIQKFIQNYDTAKIVLTGHSLGGALAYIASTKFKCHSMYTFGTPRAVFGKSQENGGPIHRFVNCSDLVSTLPPAIFGFKHVGKLYFIDGGQEILEDIGNKYILSQVKSSGGYLFKGNSFSRGNAALRSLVDHAPINYSRALSRHLLTKELEN